MAEFATREVEGMRQVVIRIAGERVRARRGALSNMHGDIRLIPRVPGAGDLVRSVFTHEARVRPWYEGSGTIHLQPSMSGYHIFDVAQGERWILEPGRFWACDGSVHLGLTREPMFASLWAGDGLLNWKTTMSGAGRAAISAPGPVEVVSIEADEMRVQGRLVLGRTDGLTFSSHRSAPFPRNLISGQKRLRVFSGTGKLLVCWTPYWNEFMFQHMTGETVAGSLYE
jgi:uncharacterized protein (AIM24 family)